MRIELFVRDGKDVPALLHAEVSCLALKPEDIEKMKNFDPRKLDRLVIYRDNGNIFSWTPDWEVK